MWKDEINILEKEVGYLHIIPFDLGYAFYDVLSIDNSKNLQMTDVFLNLLSVYCEEKGFHIERTFELKQEKKRVYGYKCYDELVDNSLCRIRLSENLYLFILMSGIGCFVILDDGRLYFGDTSIVWESDIFEIIYVKRRSQQALLASNNTVDEVNSLANKRILMNNLMEKSWEILRSVSKRHKVKCVREYSSNINYKNNGLSYVLTIYLFSKNDFTDKELKYLLYSPLVDEIGITRQKANKLINEFEIEKIYFCLSSQARYMFSWSAVSAEMEKVPKTFDEIFNHTGLSRIIKKEIYVQSKWFLADNSLDNAMKSFNNKLVGLQRLDGVLEQNEAELNNEIGANMTTEEKKILQNIIYTSDIKPLYSSVKCQIRIQMKLNEEFEEKIKKRNVFILSIFMAVFTACSLYSEVNSIITGEQQNIILLISILFIAVGAVVIDYLNK